MSEDTLLGYVNALGSDLFFGLGRMDSECPDFGEGQRLGGEASISAQLIDSVLALVEKALRGAIKIDDLHHSWPQEVSQDLFLGRVLEDLEYAVEHFPGHWLSGKPDIKAWKRSDEYLFLYLDLLLLRSGGQSGDLLNCRDAASGCGFRSEAEVESFLSSRGVMRSLE